MKMFKKTLLPLLTISASAALFATFAICAGAETSASDTDNQKSVTDYTYTITPLLAPFNQYFFVKTDNPDPTSFRFADKSSIYSEESAISVDWDDWDDKIYIYEDINYENEQTGRVNGGYIFKSSNTDGGEIVLQSKNDAYYSRDITWSDTSVKLTLPELKDDVDYLIDTYATQSGFFDNMDAVESGFSSICLYSGSYIRGQITKTQEYWGLSTSPHKDQLFYLQSPYLRQDNIPLFASAIYPYRYDSLGFPSVMATIAKRLDSSSTYVWNSYNHYLVDITYGGETRSYGGAGYGEGQGINEDKIIQYFTFGTDGTNITLESARQLLNDYSAIEMDDDVPRENALTWQSVCDRVDTGAWVRLIGIKGIFGATSTDFTYLYKKGDGTNHSTDSAGNNGSEIYWGGDLGYASDAWVDGRYVDSWECFIPGAKYEDHPTSGILSDVPIPQITYDYDYKYNSETGKYELQYTILGITEKVKKALFRYSESEDIWTVNNAVFDDNCADYSKIVSFVEKGLIDERYLDMLTLTHDEVKALRVDRNTDAIPDDYYIYDRTTAPGTSLKEHKHNYSDKVTKQPTCTADGVRTYTCSICGGSYTEAIKATGHKYVATLVKPTTTAQGYTLHKCSVCGASYKDNYTAKLTNSKTLSAVTGLKLGGRAADALRLNWTKNTNATGYTIEKYDGSKWVQVAKITNNATTTYRVAGLKAGTAYKFRMRAYKTEGTSTVYSAYTSTLTATTNPSKVTGLKLGGRASNALRLNWTKNANASGYIVEQYKSGKWVRIAKITSNATTTYRVSGLKAGTAYKFRVKAYKMNGKTAIYSKYTKTLAARTNPSKVSGLKIGGKASTALRLNWAKNSSADGYIIEMYKGGKWVRAAKITKNSTVTYKKSGLAKNTTYKFRIKAYKMSGKTALYSGYTTISGKTTA